MNIVEKNTNMIELDNKELKTLTDICITAGNQIGYFGVTRAGVLPNKDDMIELIKKITRRKNIMMFDG